MRPGSAALSAKRSMPRAGWFRSRLRPKESSGRTLRRGISGRDAWDGGAGQVGTTRAPTLREMIDDRVRVLAPRPGTHPARPAACRACGYLRGRPCAPAASCPAGHRCSAASMSSASSARSAAPAARSAPPGPRSSRPWPPAALVRLRQPPVLRAQRIRVMGTPAPARGHSTAAVSDLAGCRVAVDCMGWSQACRRLRTAARPRAIAPVSS
jgi:hypothetical protein